MGESREADPLPDDDDRSQGTVRFNGLVGALTQISFAVQYVLDEVLEAERVSIIQGRLLFSLLRSRPTVSDVAVHLRVERSSASELISRAQSRGFVERVRDGGNTYVELTPAGREIAEDMLRALKRELGAQIALLEPTEQDSLTELLEQLLRQMRSRGA